MDAILACSSNVRLLRANLALVTTSYFAVRDHSLARLFYLEYDHGLQHSRVLEAEVPGHVGHGLVDRKLLVYGIQSM